MGLVSGGIGGVWGYFFSEGGAELLFVEVVEVD